VVSALALLVGCGAEAPPLEAELELAGGRVVRVRGPEIVLAVDGRSVFATAARGPVARTFTERARGPLGIYTFTRLDQEDHVFSRVTRADVVDDAAVVELAGPRGATAALTISPGPRPDTSLITLAVDGLDHDSLAMPLSCDEAGSFHGFGAQYDASDHRGEAFPLFVGEQGIGRRPGAVRDVAGDAHTTYFPMPYHLDARGHGLLLQTDRRVDVDLCATDPDAAWLEVVSGAPIEALVLHGPTPLDVVRQLSDEVGRPARPPPWAWRPWIGVQGGRDAVLAEADALEAASVPVGALWVQDWTGPRFNVSGGFGVQYRWVADEAHYPDLAGLIAELSTRGLRFLAYANPFVDPELDDHFPEMSSRGLLIADDTGAPYVFAAPNGASSHPDLTDPGAREHVVAHLAAMVTELGIDGWMADFGEWNPLDATLDDGSDPVGFHNRYPVEWHRVNREAMECARPEGDWVTFARSGFTGVQRHSMIHWVGDQEADFSSTDGLPTVVPAMTSLGLAAIPYVTHDIAGFSGGPSTRELFMRWTELGAFTPIMRTHEGDRRDLNHGWDSDAETTAHFRRFAQIHEALGPDLETLADEADSTSAPMVRHPLLVFPEDRATWSIADQYMLGDLMVAPVVEEGATSRAVYLPAGSAWFHVFTGERLEGGATVTVDAPLGRPPVFSRDADRSDLRGI
jgi:alpha-glucosidase